MQTDEEIVRVVVCDARYNCLTIFSVFNILYKVTLTAQYQTNFILGRYNGVGLKSHGYWDRGFEPR